MFFWNSHAFSMIQGMLAIWSLVPLPFLNLAWTSGIHGSRTVEAWPGGFEHYFASLWGSLSILWHCLSLGLEWKLTFFSPVATVEFSTFAGIMSAVLSWHQFLGFEIAQLEFHHLHYLCSWWCFLMSTWLRIPGCLALGEWSHHRDYLSRDDLFNIVLLYILDTSS